MIRIAITTEAFDALAATLRTTAKSAWSVFEAKTASRAMEMSDAFVGHLTPQARAVVLAEIKHAITVRVVPGELNTSYRRCVVHFAFVRCLGAELSLDLGVSVAPRLESVHSPDEPFEALSHQFSLQERWLDKLTVRRSQRQGK
jgi:hypothetical protein